MHKKIPHFESPLCDIFVSPKEIIYFLNHAIDKETRVVITQGWDSLHHYTGSRDQVRKEIKISKDFEYFQDNTLKDVFDFTLQYQYELEQHFGLKQWSKADFITQMIGVLTNNNYINSLQAQQLYGYYVQYSQTQISKSVYTILGVSYSSANAKPCDIVSYTEIEDFNEKLKTFSVYCHKDKLEQAIQVIWPRFLYELISDPDFIKEFAYDILEDIDLGAFRKVLDVLWVDEFIQTYDKLSINCVPLINDLEELWGLKFFLKSHKTLDYAFVGTLPFDALYDFAFLVSRVWIWILKMNQRELRAVLENPEFIEGFREYLERPNLPKKHNSEHFNDYRQMLRKKRK